MLYYYIYEYLYYNDHHLAENRELVERQKILINMTVPTVTMERCFHPPSLREKIYGKVRPELFIVPGSQIYPICENAVL